MENNTSKLVDMLDDTCFNEVASYLVNLCELIEEEIGTKPTLIDLCEIRTISLRECRSDLLSDVDVQAVEKLTPKIVPHKKIRLIPGDILAIPRVKGGYYFVLFITSNQMGYAFGIFEGYSQIPHIPSNWDPIPVKYPVYTGREMIINGRWRRIDHRKAMLEKFPKSPEFFHNKAYHLKNDLVGPYGSGETVEGDLRNLSEAEAQEIGLIQGFLSSNFVR